jgi:tetratricopeptide (TPR) repeat protein
MTNLLVIGIAAAHLASPSLQHCYHSLMAPSRALISAWALAGMCAQTPLTGGSQDTPAALRERGVALAYDLDHDEALALLRRAAAQAPDDPSTHRSLASVLWLNMLFRRGAVTVDHYLGSLTRQNVELKKPPPEADREFREHITRAIELAEKRVNAEPGNAQAHYDLGAALGIQASYIATVEGKQLAGFKAARRAYDEHEKVLGLEPNRKDAQLVVGTYRYVVSTLSLPMRWMAYVAGFGGGRERGIQMLEEAAATGRENRTDALFALVLVYNRERRYDGALKALQELRRLHPKNRLLLLEAGATALRANRLEVAEAVLTEGLAMLAGEKRARIPGEESLWRLKRGTARVAAGRLEEGLADLRVASGADAANWVQGRARVELARVALKRGERPEAAEQARQAQALCEQGRDPACVEEAQKLMRSSHGR